jgi:NADH-quinone oxidoreductase subunit N
MSFQDVLTTAPLIAVAATACLVLLIDALKKNSEALTVWVSGAGLAFALGIAMARIQTGGGGLAFGGMITSGGSANFFTLIFCSVGILTLLLSWSYVRTAGMMHGEYFALVLFAIAGMILMASAADFVIFFIGLEIMSVAFYVLAGFARNRLDSNEAGLKYFLLGAFATGFLLYGIALLYGATGTTALAGLPARAAALAHTPVFAIGLGLFVIGLAFKVAAVPFHMWVPDVYEGSPTTVSGFMSTGGKAAAFSGFLLVFVPAVVGAVPAMRDVLAVLAAASMIAGNVIAIAQTSVKRMLAYSSIAHAGYILVGIVAGNAAGHDGVLFYLMSYAMMNIGAFGVLGLLEDQAEHNLTVDAFAGLSKTSPSLAAFMALFMFSLAGIPPFAGFFGKYYVFAGAIAGGYTWLAIAGVLMSAVSAYFYLRLVVVMYFKEPEGSERGPIPFLGLTALALAALAILVFGLFPSTLLGLAVRPF